MWEAIVKISWVYFLSCAVVLYDAFPVPLVTTGIYIYIYIYIAQRKAPKLETLLQNNLNATVCPFFGSKYASGKCLVSFGCHFGCGGRHFSFPDCLIWFLEPARAPTRPHTWHTGRHKGQMVKKSPSPRYQN